MAGTATQSAVEALRQLIFSGELGPGSDHLEGELADRLGVSRTPIREALLILETQGLVHVRPRRGARILAIAPQEMENIYEVITELEAYAAGRAARLCKAGQLDAGALEGLREAIEQMDTALDQGDRRAWARADEVFHARLVAAAQNPRLTVACDLYVDQIRRARSQTLFLRPLPTASSVDQRNVVVAISKGDEAAARRIHHAHLDHARRMLSALLADHNLQRL